MIYFNNLICSGEARIRLVNGEWDLILKLSGNPRVL